MYKERAFYAVLFFLCTPAAEALSPPWGEADHASPIYLQGLPWGERIQAKGQPPSSRMCCWCAPYDGVDPAESDRSSRGDIYQALPPLRAAVLTIKPPI